MYLVFYLIKKKKQLNYTIYCEVTLKLSSAFEVQSKEKNEIVPLELIVKVVDIRYSKQHGIIKKRSSLQEYSYFIQKVQDYKLQKKTNDEAIQLAITECIKKGILKEFLEKNSSEVFNMCAPVRRLLYSRWKPDMVRSSQPPLSSLGVRVAT